MDRDKAIRAALLTAKGIKNRNGFDQGGAETGKGIPASEYVDMSWSDYLDNLVRNAPSSIANLVSDTADFADLMTNPARMKEKIEFAKNLTQGTGQLAYGAGSKVARNALGYEGDPAGEAALDSAAAEMAGHYGLGQPGEFWKNLAEDPASYLGDAAAVLSGGTGATMKALKVIDDAQLRQLDEFADLYANPKQDVSTFRNRQFYEPSSNEISRMEVSLTPDEAAYWQRLSDSDTFLRRGVSAGRVADKTSILRIPRVNMQGDVLGDPRELFGATPDEMAALRPDRANYYGFRVNRDVKPEYMGDTGYFLPDPGREELWINPLKSQKEQDVTEAHEMTHADQYITGVPTGEGGTAPDVAARDRLDSLNSLDSRIRETTDPTERARLKDQFRTLRQTSPTELYYRNPGEMLANLSSGQKNMAKQLNFSQSLNPYINKNRGPLERVVDAVTQVTLADTTPHMTYLQRKNILPSINEGTHRGVPIDVSKAIVGLPFKSRGGALELARHATAVGRAGGQVAPSKYMPNVPRAVHADGGKVERKRDFQNDNPGGEWLEGKQARAAQYPDDKFMVGATTGVIGGRSSMFLPTHVLKGIAGLNDEVRTSGVHKYDSLLSDAREGGFDPDQKGNKVVVAVNHYGQPYLLEGNTRVAVAHSMGIPKVKAEVRYWNGAENVDGPMHPEKVFGMASDNADIAKADGGRVSYGNGGKSLGLYSKAAQIIRNQPQAKGSVDQLLAMVSKTKGVKPAELTNAGRPAGDAMSKEELAKHFEDALPKVDVERIGGRDSNGFPQYEEYTLPGGENYREHLLHLSDEREPPKALHRVMGAFPRDFDSEEGARQYIRQLDTLRNTPGMEGIAESLTRYPAIYQRENGRSTNPTDFKSSHWGTPNVLAHVRMSDRDNGETLHVHEVQSDWGQEGREKGFHDPEKPFEVVNKKTKEVVSRHPDYSSMWDAYRTHPDSDNLTYGDVRNEKPPQGPYVGNTQQWTDLALKHIMMEAAKGGYKRVVFSPGEANADLYGQRKEVSKLEFLKSNDSGEAGILSGFTPNGYYSSQHDVESHADLPKLIGKENAANLLAQPPTPSPDKGEDRYTHTLQGPLLVGGHGMVDYYKNYVNQGAMKLLQQHDQSAKPESYDLPEGYKGFALPVTDTSRESILKNGFQAFQRGGEVHKATGGQVMGYVPMATLPVSRLAVARAPQYQQQAPVARFSDSLNSLMDTVEGFKKKPDAPVDSPSAATEGHSPIGMIAMPESGYEATGMYAPFQSAIDQMIADAPGKITVTSGYRTPERQEELWNEHAAKYPDPEVRDNYVARPGQSSHNYGLAADLSYADEEALKWAQENAAKYGLNFRMGHEDWHIEPANIWELRNAMTVPGYSNGGSAMDDNNQDKGMENGTTPINFATRPQAGELPDAGGIRGGAGVLQAQNEAPLEGLPQKIVIPMTGQIIHAGADPRIRQVARDYMAQAGLPYSPPTKYARVDPKRAARIASDYTNMEDNPDDPLTKASYNAMIKETMDQYHAAKKSGLKIEFWNPRKQEDPYKASPRLATEDVRRNHHMWVFPTYSGYGSGEPISEDDAKRNPLLQLTGETWNGIPVTVNDVFRAIHDYYGHAKEGLGFRADGEENAWRAHASMFSPLARMAMTSETRGQNSWLNYGPHGEHNRKARTEDTIFAPQKIGVLSHLSHHEGAEDFIKPEEISLMASIRSRFGKKLGGAVDAALALTRRFTKDGKSAISALKTKGK